MSENLGENASKPEPSLEVCAEFLIEARKMLAHAWDNPGVLGEESEICAEATLLHRKIRQYCSPQETDAPEARKRFIEALRVSWLAVWRARDYSIEGTKRRAKARGWSLAEDYILEDRLRRQLGREYGGARWQAIHFPAYDRNGEPLSAPGGRGPISDISTGSTQEVTEGAVIADANLLEGRRLSLRWALVQSPLPEGGWDLDNALVAGALTLQSKTMAPGSFQNAIFLATPTILYRGSNLDAAAGARFEEGVSFSNCRFSGPVRFPPTIESGPFASFLNSEFENELVFSEANGVRRLQLHGILVKGSLAIRDMPNSIVVDASAGANRPPTFGSVAAPQVSFAAINLSRAIINGRANFAGCTFVGQAAFDETRFATSAEFMRSRFLGIAAPQFASFYKAKFIGAANFALAQFGEKTDVPRATAVEEALFTQAEFLGTVSFQGAKFRCDAQFDNAAFSNELNCSSLGSELTEFFRKGTFKGGLGDGEGEPHDTLQSAKFDNAIFHDGAILRNRKFEDDTSFNGVTFHRPPHFHGSEFHAKTSFSAARYKWEAGLKLTGWQRFLGSRAPWAGKLFRERLNSDNLYLADVSDAFRVLTTLAKKIESPELAFQFHREEQRARHRRAIDANVPRSDAFAGAAYGFLSNYGESLSRPLIGMGVLFAMFATIYALLIGDSPLECALWEPKCEVSLAVTISAERTLLPFLAHSTPVAQEWHIATTDATFWASTFGMFHRLMATILVFLLALALRRKFQLS